MGTGNFVHDAGGHFYEFEEGTDLAVEIFGFVTSHGLGLVAAAAQDFEGGIDFASFTFADEGGEHAPDIFLGLEVFFALAFSDDATNEAPADEFPEVGVGIAAADFEFVHDFVGGERTRGDEEEGVNLGHGPIDAPGVADGAPLGDKVIAGLLKAGVGLRR